MDYLIEKFKTFIESKIIKYDPDDKESLKELHRLILIWKGRSTDGAGRKIEEWGIPDEWRKVDDVLYRGLNVPEELVNGTYTGFKHKKYTSWTTSLKIAKKFAKSGKYSNGIIFKHKWELKNIILNIKIINDTILYKFEGESEVIIKGTHNKEDIFLIYDNNKWMELNDRKKKYA